MEEEIVEKDIKELTSKKKNFRISIKKTLIGILSASIIYSTIPNIEYKIALYKANSSPFIIETMKDNTLTKEEQIALIFEKAINSNDKIPEETKKIVIDAFTSEVINRAGIFFTDKTIKNMYAVASTQRITQMSEFSREHGWWSGDYNPYINTYSLSKKPEEASKSLIAHEQLHAILKNGMFNSGFTNGLEGFGLNEGMTSLFGKNDYSYVDETNIANVLGMIIGYNNLIKHYVNSDLQGLKEELKKYISEENINKLINNIDLEVFKGFYKTLAENNGLPYLTHEAEKISQIRKQENMKILREIFINKYDMLPEESNLGRLIFNSGYFISDEQIEKAEKYYTFTFYDKDNVKITIHKPGIEGVAEGIVNKTKEEVMDNEEKTAELIISEEFGIDDVCGGYISQINDNQCLITLKGISLIFENENLEETNIEEKFVNAISRIEATNDLEKDDDKEVD